MRTDGQAGRPKFLAGHSGSADEDRDPRTMHRRQRKRRPCWRPPELSVPQILAWADAYHERHGQWPRQKSGRIPGSLGENWRKVDNALRYGLRGLPGKCSLAQLLADHRGVRNQASLPRLTFAQILIWADAHHHRTGSWPTPESDAVTGPQAPDATWASLDQALRTGYRGLPGGASLGRLLAEHRRVRSRGTLPRLTVRQILAWADAHHRRTGSWPTRACGLVTDAPEETWMKVDEALRRGWRGLPRGGSLARLLAARRGTRNRAALPPLTVSQILVWADTHRRRKGQWPTRKCGKVCGVPGQTWHGVDAALQTGLRGLPGGSSLPQLLAEERGVRNIKRLPRLKVKQILAWADAHRSRTGAWPKSTSGPVVDAPGETWGAVHSALQSGLRGLPRGSSLPRLLEQYRGVRNRLNPPEQILGWAKDHYGPEPNRQNTPAR